MKLMAPITPHFTEEIYHLYFAEKEKLKSIHNSEWPKYDEKLEDDVLGKTGDSAVGIIQQVRKFKADNKISLGQEIKELIIKTEDDKSLEPFLEDIKSTTRAKEIKFEGKADIEINEKLKIGIGV